MAALWIILKIIGIILLCIFVFLLLILFAPAGYRARGVYNGWEKWAKARVSWLFFFLRMKVSWKEGEEPAVSLRILGFPVYHSDEERWSLLNRKAADDVVEIRESGKDIETGQKCPGKQPDTRLILIRRQAFQGIFWIIPETVKSLTLS